MPLLRGPVAAFAAVMLCTVALPADGAQRTFVSTGGSDSSACSLVAPCRSFTAALSRTDADGEIIVLDSGGYGPVSIAQSVAITAPPGVYAGISVLSNDGVTIATPGVRVALRGLTINGLGGFAGINLSQGARLEVERCTIGGLAYGLFATAANATIVLTDSVVSDSGNKGVYLVASAMTATLERVRIERTSGIGGDGLYLGGGIRASVRESTIVGNGASGILATDSVAAGPSLVVSHSVVTDNVQYGVILVALQSTTARASISDSVLARNGQGGIVTYATAAGGVAITDITLAAACSARAATTRSSRVRTETSRARSARPAGRIDRVRPLTRFTIERLYPRRCRRPRVFALLAAVATGRYRRCRRTWTRRTRRCRTSSLRARAPTA